MEDAIALVAALDSAAPGARPDAAAVDAALARYETARRPQVTRIQDAARPSLSWWEHFGRTYTALPPWQFAYHFFSRSLPESKLCQRDPGFVRAVHQAWRAAHGGTGASPDASPLPTPIDIGGVPQPCRVVPVVTGVEAGLASGPLPLHPLQLVPGPDASSGRWGLWVSAPDTEAGLGEAAAVVARGVAAGAALVAVGDGTGLTRRLVCEAARLERGAVTMLVEDSGAAGIDDAACAAVLSGRADLVGVPAPAAVPDATGKREH